MYTFTIKDNGPDLDIVITRAMLALAAIAGIFYRNDAYYLTLIASVILILAAIFIKSLLIKFGINKLLIVSFAAFMLFIATRSIILALILLFYGSLVKLWYKKPAINVNKNGVIIRRPFTSSTYQWNDFDNIILKDNLLTLDFKNNKLVQLQIKEESPATEIDFNKFVKSFL